MSGELTPFPDIAGLDLHRIGQSLLDVVPILKMGAHRPESLKRFEEVRSIVSDAADTMHALDHPNGGQAPRTFTILEREILWGIVDADLDLSSIEPVSMLGNLRIDSDTARVSRIEHVGTTLLRLTLPLSGSKPQRLIDLMTLYEYLGIEAQAVQKIWSENEYVKISTITTTVNRANILLKEQRTGWKLVVNQGRILKASTT